MSEMKPYIIIIPSPLILARTYNRLAYELSDKFQVLIPDLPGTGFFRSRGTVWNEKKYAAWIYRFINDLHITKAFFLGHSNSGPIAIQMAVDYPNKVQGIILADSIGLKTKGALHILKGRAMDAFIELPFTILATKDLLLNLFLHPLNFLNQLHLSFATDISQTLEKLKSSLLILWGSRDHATSLRSARKIGRQISTSQLYISDGSHDWVITKPKEASDVIKKYCFKTPKEEFINLCL